MNPESLQRLKRNLKVISDDDLIALANRGLMRRATKDLEQSDRFELSESDDAIVVSCADWNVTMPPEGPAGATDDTPASGVTRQILAATMYLRDHWLPNQVEAEDASSTDGATQAQDSSHESQTPQAAGASEDLAAATERSNREAAALLVDASPLELAKWNGKTPLLEATAALNSAGEPKVTYHPQLRVEFPQADVRVILMTDEPAATLRKLLDQFKSTAPRSESARWILTAVLALQAAEGNSLRAEQISGSEVTEAVRQDRLRVANKTRRLLAVLTSTGMAHASTRVIERLQTAAVAAEAARFPRLAKLLSSLSDDVELQISRDVAADPQRMVSRLAVAFALSEACSNSKNADRNDLFGSARSTYLPAGDLTLAGIGAHGWKTASGYEGVTALFWDMENKCFRTASAARGEGQDRLFSIQSAYESGLGWAGGSAISSMCRQTFVLANARSNSFGRLSTAESCRVQNPTPTDSDSLEFGESLVEDWTQLNALIEKSQMLGLRLADPRAACVVIQPTEWGKRWFDELEQSFVWEVFDEAGHALQIRLPWNEVEETSVTFLESIKLAKEKPFAIVGRLEVGAGRAWVYPLSVLSSGTSRGDKVLCPQFDRQRILSWNQSLLERLRKKFGREPVVQTRIGDDAEEELLQMRDDLQTLPPLIQSLVVDLDQVVFAALESGNRTLTDDVLSTLRSCDAKLQSLGAHILSQGIARLLLPRPSSTDFLRAGYLLQLFRQSLNLQYFSS